VIVADTTLIACFTVHNVQADLADAIYEADPDWTAPILWRSELRNVIVKYMKHAGMSMDSAILALESAEETISGHDYHMSSERVLELAMASQCTAYACEYVLLAQDLGVSLVTADRQLLGEFPETAVSFEKFLKKS
jgi:predicted nucleic acid-binding protein